MPRSSIPDSRTLRRRRAIALVALAVAIGAIAWLLVGGGSASSRRSHAGRSASAPRAAAPASLRVKVARIGSLPSAVQDAAVAATPSGILVMGGLDAGEASLPDIVLLGREGGRGARIGALPAPLHDACAAAVGADAYVFGGGQVSSFSQITRVSASGAVAAAGTLPTPASDVACASWGAGAYVVGGNTGEEALRTILFWRPHAAPVRAALLPKPLRYAAVAATSQGIVIAGGTSGETVSSDVYRFDPSSGSVRRLARLPYPVTHAAGASLDGYALVIGGRGEGAHSQRGDLLAISPDGHVSVAGELPGGLSDVGAASLAGVVALAGGVDRAGAPQSSVLELAPRG